MGEVPLHPKCGSVGEENIAQFGLDRLALRSSAPKVRREVRHARKKCNVVASLFPGFIFCHSRSLPRPLAHRKCQLSSVLTTVGAFAWDKPPLLLTGRSFGRPPDPWDGVSSIIQNRAAIVGAKPVNCAPNAPTSAVTVSNAPRKTSIDGHPTALPKVYAPS